MPAGYNEETLVTNHDATKRKKGYHDTKDDPAVAQKTLRRPD